MFCRLTSCLSTDVIIRIELYVVMKLFVDWRHVCQPMKLQTGTPGHKWRPGHREYKWRPGTLKEKLQTGTPGHKSRPGHREYKWRPGHRNTTTTGTPGAQGGYTNEDRDTGIVRREITDRETRTQMTTGTPGHREYKWRPGHSKRNYKLGHLDTNDDQDTGNINDDRDTGTKLQRGRRGAEGDI